MRVGRNQIQAARVADLYGYLLQYHPTTVRKAGHDRLQNIAHDSLIITRGRGYCHNSKHETGNGIDYLMRYLDYTFQRAVASLSAFHGVQEPSPNSTTPEQTNRLCGAYKRVYAYLTQTRAIPCDIVSELITKKLLYEDDRHNCVFDSQKCNYAELVGTLSDIRFKGIRSKSDSDGYWMMGNETATTVYICESAIDAISLYAIQRTIDEERCRLYAFASIGGLKPAAVRSLMSQYETCVLAVDHDEAGDTFASDFQNLRRIRPFAKDWNEDLKNKYGAGKKNCD